jgi:hypothetical protein
MARDIFGNRRITKEDMYTKKVYSKSDFRWEYFKGFLYLLFGYIYFHFIVMGWSV